MRKKQIAIKFMALIFGIYCYISTKTNATKLFKPKLIFLHAKANKGRGKNVRAVSKRVKFVS